MNKCSGNVHIYFLRDSGLKIVFYEYDSEFNGNDFEFSYSLDARNTTLFLDMIPHRWAEPKSDIEEWLVKNVRYDGFGGDLQEKWIQMGLHGTHVVREDYPGGIYRRETF